ncbi:MAG: hypothetical protein KKA84_12065 [Bacteroidetes bacterium]|nr:hypothetical protein [Bacteroidota bacterium]
MSTKLEILQKLKGSLVLLGKAIFAQAVTKPSPAFHYELSDLILDTSIKFLNIIAPRGSAKTTLVAILNIIHHLMFGRDKKVIIIVSRTQGHAINILQTIKDILDYNQNFRQLFGYWGVQSAKKWTSTEIVLKDGSAIICKGMGQMLRGMNIGGQRPTLIILDDPEDENNTKTKEGMENNFKWLLQAAVPALDADRGRMIVIGTPLNERSIIMQLQMMKRWVTKHYSYLYENEDGETVSLWAEMKSVEELLAEKADLEIIGKVSVFYKERMCQIIGDEDQLFREDYIKHWDGTLEYRGDDAYLNITYLKGEGSVNKIVPVNVFMGVDPASSIQQSADYSVIFPIAVDRSQNVYCLPYFRKRVPPMEVGRQVLVNYNNYKPRRTQIETTGYQEMLRDYLKEVCIKKGIFIPGLELKNNPRTAKSKRIESLQPRFAQGKVYLKVGMQEFEDELLMFPRGKHDDLIDGYYYAVKGLYVPYHGVVNKNPDMDKYLSEIQLQVEDDWQEA